VYPHYHADHIGDIAKYVDAAKLANSSFPQPTEVVKWPRDAFEFEGLTVELHGFE
jgi:hypothetical protein